MFKCNNFVVGESVSFFYNGELRRGTVKRVTNKVVTLFDEDGLAFRSFTLSKIAPSLDFSTLAC